MSTNTLTITDNRTNKKYEIPIEEGDVIRAADLRQIKVGKDDFGLMSYDPAFTNTASCRSRITFIDGDKGILHYRGYPIEELAEKSNYLETAYLIVKGELRTRSTTIAGRTTSRSTRWCTRASRRSWRAIATTRIRWGCCSGRSARSRRFTPTPMISTISNRAGCRRAG